LARGKADGGGARSGGPAAPRTGRELARQVLLRVEADGAYASRALGAALDRSSATLSQAERGLATELVYGVLRRRARLDRALDAVSERGLGDLEPEIRNVLRVGAYQLLFLDRVPGYAAVNETVEAAKAIKGGRYRGLANALLRRVSERGEPPLPDATVDPAGHMVASAGFPPWLARLALRELGPARALAFAQAVTGPSWLCLRANPLAGFTRARLRAAIAVERPEARLEDSALAPDALVADNLDAPATLEAFTAGGFAIQDVGAQVIAELCGAAPGERILDACAGLGGKTAHLAALADNRADIEACDISGFKLGAAREQLARLGVRGVRTRTADLTARLPPDAGPFDRVLLDAPCSGLGVLRRHPEALLRKTEANLALLAEAQKRLLENVAEVVRPGGLLVYAVCTFDEAESQGVVDAFLAANPHFRPESPPEGAPTPRWADLTVAPGIVRTWPTGAPATDSDAFFAARLRRSSS
jgi:16S rRNA (cytosine967-C5)-methyltransferase